MVNAHDGQQDKPGYFQSRNWSNALEPKRLLNIFTRIIDVINLSTFDLYLVKLAYFNLCSNTQVIVSLQSYPKSTYSFFYYLIADSELRI